MLKCVYLVAVLLIGGVAADTISEQDQIYVISGVFGGVCLLLTIAAIINTVNVIRLQSKVAVLQAATTASAKAVAGPQSRSQQPPPRPEELNRYPQEDPYRAAPPRESYRMERPAPPPRPQRMGPPPRDNYY